MVFLGQLGVTRVTVCADCTNVKVRADRLETRSARQSVLQRADGRRGPAALLRRSGECVSVV